MKATLIKKESYRESEEEHPIVTIHERLVFKTHKEKEFGILYHEGKYCLTDGSCIIDQIDKYIKIKFENE